MKKLILFIVFVNSCGLMYAQENIFEKINTNFTISNDTKEKISRYQLREEIKTQNSSC